MVFDKTGTLTAAGAAAVTFQGAALTNDEQGLVFSLTRHSTHPYAVRIHESLAEGRFPEPVRSFLETIGCGLEAVVGGHEMWLGSEAWLVSRNAKIPAEVHAMSGVCHLAIDGKYRGSFMLRSGVRPQAENVLSKLGDRYQLALLSGDNDRDLQRFQGLFPVSARLHFNQSPLDKLNLIQQFQREKRTVMMVGDGLNDAGALKQSDVGVAVVESVSAFSPASDVITAVAGLSSLNEVLAYSRRSVRVVRLSFLISSLYNVVGISIAARGALSPVVCAILMPLSSITVVVFACAATTWLGRSIPTQPSLGAAERGMA